MKKVLRPALLAILFLSLAAVVIFFSAKPGSLKSIFGETVKPSEITYSEFLRKIDEGVIRRVVIEKADDGGEDEALGVGDKKEEFKTKIHPIAYEDLMARLKNKGVEISFSKQPLGFWGIKIDTWMYLLISVITTAAVIFIILRVINKQVDGVNNHVHGFQKSPAKLYKPGETSVGFDDVAGIDEVKAELKEIIEFLKNPEKFLCLGAKIPKGVLLIGPPGVGKTLLARIVAKEANVPFFSISGSDFVEMFVGVGAGRVRDLFKSTDGLGKCIIFIDEIDAVGKHRQAATIQDEREQTLNQLLVEMDGFDERPGIIMIGATNRPELIDKALIRPGRFDRKITVPIPRVSGREDILKVHTKNKPLSGVDLGDIARATSGFVGADLANLANEAAICAARNNRKEITKEDFWEAKDRILLGPHVKSAVRSAEEVRIAACHEAGHALLAAVLKHAEIIEKATILSRGFTGGAVFTLSDESSMPTKEKLIAELVVLMGGRMAERLVLNTATPGAENDIERANEFIRNMVCKWGMSDLGPINLSLGQKTSLSEGRMGAASEDMVSEDMKQRIELQEKEIRNRIEEKSKNLLEQHKDTHEKIMKLLIEKETIDGSEIYEIVGEKRNSVEFKF